MLDFLKDTNGKFSGKRLMGYLLIITALIMKGLRILDGFEFLFTMSLGTILIGLSVAEVKKTINEFTNEEKE